MYGDTVSYLYAIQRSWDVQNGKILADLLCLRDAHVHNKNFHSPVSNSLIERHLGSPIDEIVANHLTVIYFLTSSGIIQSQFSLIQLKYN